MLCPTPPYPLHINSIPYNTLLLTTFLTPYCRLEAQLRNISSKTFDSLSDKSVVEYEPIDPEELSSMFLDKNEGKNSLLNIIQ
jgi:hypothetical protein